MFLMHMTKHMDDYNLGVYNSRAVYAHSVLEKGTFHPNPLIRRFVYIYICMERLYKLMYSDINLTNVPKRVPEGWTQIKCKLNVKQQQFRIIKLAACSNTA
jgi:hypothetical protein